MLHTRMLRRRCSDTALPDCYQTVPSGHHLQLALLGRTTMRTRSVYFLCLIAFASAFAPAKLTSTSSPNKQSNFPDVPTATATFTRRTYLDLNSPSSSSSNLEQTPTRRSSRRKKIVRRVGKIASAASIALATLTVSSSAHAAKVLVAKDIIDFSHITTNAAKLAQNVAVIGASAFAVGAGLNSILSKGKPPSSSSFQYALDHYFPKYRKNKDLVSSAQKILRKNGFRKKKTLVGTSFCADEINRGLEQDFAELYDKNFNMGGLAGFPFGGITSFGAMASHIPDGGSCLVVFGPHVGIDSDGTIGTVERRGRQVGGACCGSALAAAGYTSAIYHGTHSRYGPPKVADDAQQNFVGNALLPYAGHLEASKEKMVELPYALYDAQKNLMDTIVQAGASNVAGDGKIAVLGGIQINTPRKKDDLFLPLSFELYNNKGELLEDLTSGIDCGRAATYSKWTYFDTCTTSLERSAASKNTPVMDIPPVPGPVTKTVDATCFDKFEGKPVNGDSGLAQPMAAIGSIALAASDIVSSAGGTF